MLAIPNDFYRVICNNLNISNIKALTSTKRSFRKDILKDNTYWEEQFKIHFPHLVEKVIQKSQPENWYLVFEKAYIDDYKFNVPHSGSLVELSPTALAKLFTAAKSGNMAQFKKLYIQASSGPYNIEPLFYSSDKHGYSCYDWLYKNGYQPILDAIFNEFDARLKTIFSEPIALNQLKFIKLNLAIACNQENYVTEHIKNYSVIPANLLLSATRLGNIRLLKILLTEDLNIPQTSISLALIEAASHGHTELVELLYKKMLQSHLLESEKKYQSSLYESLKASMLNAHKETFKKLLYLSKANGFDINYTPSEQPLNNEKTLSILNFSLEIEDASYAKMVLEAGGKVNYRDAYDCSPLENAIYKANYDLSIELLRNGIEFESHDYTRIKKWIARFNDSNKKIDPRIRALTELMLYKYEIKNSPETTGSLGSWIYGMFHIERPQDKTVQNRVCNMLLEIIAGKRLPNDLETLTPVEQKILKNETSQLANVYHILLS